MRYEDTHPESAARWAKVLRERRAADERDESWTRGPDAFQHSAGEEVKEG